MKSHRPDIEVALVPHIKPSIAAAQRVLRIAMVAALCAIAASFAGFKLPGALAGINFSVVLLALVIGNAVTGALSSSGAFEVTDLQTGQLLYSKLATGELPTVQQILNHEPVSVKGSSAVSAAALAPSDK